MKNIKNSILIIFLICFGKIASAQNDTSIARKNTLTAGLNYQSRLHYFGRTDSLKSAGLFPNIGFETKPGFYANANFVFLDNASKSFNYSGTVLEGGFKFPESRNFSGNIFYTHFLYNTDVQLVQAALKGQTGINLTYNNKVVNVTLGGDAKFSNQTDFGLTAGLDHLFIYVIPNTKFAVAVNPSAYAYAGTQNFTNTYYKERRTIGGIALGQQKITEEVQKFNVLAYELSLPVVLVAGKFNASVTGSFVMPQHLVKVANRPDLNENGTNMLYLSAGIGVRL
jgi:hypothetical protein